MRRSLLLLPLIVSFLYLHFRGISLTYSDAAEYAIEGLKIWKKLSSGTHSFIEVFIQRFWKPTSFPFFVTLFYFPTKGSLYWGPVLALLANFSVLILSIYFLLKRFIDFQWAIVLTCLFCFQAPFFSNALHLMSEGPALSFWVLSLALYFSHHPKRFLLAGIALGIAATFSPVLTFINALALLTFLLWDEFSKKNYDTLFCLWPPFLGFVYFILFYKSEIPLIDSPYPLIALGFAILLFAPLVWIKTKIRHVYFFFLTSTLIAFVWFCLHVTMLWDWINTCSFSEYAVGTGRYSTLRQAEYLSYLNILPLGFATIWFFILVSLSKELFLEKKKLFWGLFFILSPVVLALSFSNNGDLRYFKWSAFLLLVGPFLITWQYLTLRKRKALVFFLALSSVLTIVDFFTQKNVDLEKTIKLSKKLSPHIPSNSIVGMAPLGSQYNFFLQNRSVFTWLSYQEGKKNQFVFLSNDEENLKNLDWIFIGPCESRNEPEPSMPSISLKYAKLCPQFNEQNSLHFVAYEISKTKSVIIVLKK